ncbi:MAG: YdiU family protein [Marinovum sp.]|nr:YdiU family protein [Marinovum sp.]
MTQDPLVIPFDNSYNQLPARFYTRLDPEPVPAPSLIAFNRQLASDMGITGGRDAELEAVFSGNTMPKAALPIAQVYSGHQFGQYNPYLGDGRALLLGETLGQDQKRRDIQLKGSGRTPYSRGGDGRAWLGPVLREYLVSEAMHHMGIATTRALAAVATGAPVLRETALPGAVLTRVADSHIRVGTFQFFAAQRDIDGLKTLLDYTIARHYPQADGALGFLKAVIEAQAKLIAQWMGVGFIHGVMNTDNCQIAGQTIDYGPCAFLDRYNPMRVYSSIDYAGRYAYGNQPNIIVWNMAQLATALMPLMPDTDAGISTFTAAVHAMPKQIERHQRAVFAAKIGISAPKAGDNALIGDLLALMADGQADFTNSFRALGTVVARDQFLEPDKFDHWQERWQRRLDQEPDAESVMARSNPSIIPRNHRIEEMISAATNGDYAPFHRLLSAIKAPYSDAPEFADLRRPPSAEEEIEATFCGT